MARIHLIYDKCNWRPTRYWWSDHPQQQQDMDDLLWHIGQPYECWVRRDVAEILTGDYVPSGPLVDGKWHYPALWAPEARTLPGNVVSWDFCEEHCAGFIRNVDGTPDLRRPEEFHVSEVLCKYGSGLNCMLQQAILEGFNPIYLVGADLGYKARPDIGDDDRNHFSPRYHQGIRDVSIERANIDNDTQVDMHQMAKAYVDEKDIQILNASLGGSLEVYPRVDFYSLFDG